MPLPGVYLQRISMNTSNSCGRQSFLTWKRGTVYQKMCSTLNFQKVTLKHMYLSQQDWSLQCFLNRTMEEKEHVSVEQACFYHHHHHHCQHCSLVGDSGELLQNKGMMQYSCTMQYHSLVPLVHDLHQSSNKATAELCYLENFFAEVQLLTMG